MLIIVLILTAGILLGLSIPRISALIKLNEGILTLTIYLIFFMIAVLTGVDDLIVKSIDSIGWPAFLLILITAVCGIAVSWLFYKFLLRRITHNRLFTADSGK